jgi:hypothetical protein
MRELLPQRRNAETFVVVHQNGRFTVTVGFYPDGRLGEIFVNGGKSGADIEQLVRDAGVILSLALQHGTPIETLRHAVTRDGTSAAASVLGAILDCISTGTSGDFQ